VPPPPDVPTVAPVQPDAVGDSVPVVPSVTTAPAAAGSDEDPPRHGVSPLDSSPPHLLAPDKASGTTVLAVHGGGGTTTGVAPPAALVAAHAAPAAGHARTARDQSAGAAPRAPHPFNAPPSPVPPTPAPPALLGASAPGGHGDGSSSSAALTTMTLAGLILVFLSRIRSIARPLRRAGPVTQPHPPG
jgi:hypothetical protein